MEAARPRRVRAAPARFDEEQAEDADMAALLAQFRNPMRDESSSSDSSDSSGVESEAEEGDEHKAPVAPAAALAWSAERHPIVPNEFLPPRRPPARPLNVSLHSISFTCYCRVSSLTAWSCRRTNTGG